jgi:hypothetical protein
MDIDDAGNVVGSRTPKASSASTSTRTRSCGPGPAASATFAHSRRRQRPGPRRQFQLAGRGRFERRDEPCVPVGERRDAGSQFARRSGFPGRADRGAAHQRGRCDRGAGGAAGTTRQVRS